MVISPSGIQCVIDVKGQYKRNWWNIKPKKKRKNMFYVLAFVPDQESNQFFLLSQAEARSEFQNYVRRKKVERRRKGLSTAKVGLFPGISWKAAERFEGKWGNLPK